MRAWRSGRCARRAYWRRIKIYHLDDTELATIAEGASARRADAWLAAGGTTEREAVS
jgi:hypothetical protein